MRIVSGREANALVERLRRAAAQPQRRWSRECGVSWKTFAAAESGRCASTRDDGMDWARRQPLRVTEEEMAAAWRTLSTAVA